MELRWNTLRVQTTDAIITITADRWRCDEGVLTLWDTTDDVEHFVAAFAPGAWQSIIALKEEKTAK